MKGNTHLLDLSKKMADQMNKLENHLGSINKCLLGIEDRLKKGQKTRQKFLKQKKEKTANHLLDASEQLIEACTNYLTLTERKPNATKAIETDYKKCN
jgi:hypothetical protein